MYTLIGYYDHEDYANSSWVGWHYDFDDIHPNRAKNAILSLIANKPEGFSIKTCHGDIFNLFGHLIALKKIRTEDVAVILFDKDGKELFTYYDADGFLNDYPHGFFEMDLEESGLL